MPSNIVVRKTVMTQVGCVEPINYITSYKMNDDKIEMDFSVVDNGIDRRFEVVLTLHAARRLAQELTEKTA